MVFLQTERNTRSEYRQLLAYIHLVALNMFLSTVWAAEEQWKLEGDITMLSNVEHLLHRWLCICPQL